MQTLLNRSSLILIAALVLVPKAVSQTVGIQPLGTYQGTIDQINVADLNVHIDIPVYVHRGRGNANETNVHLIYDTGYVDGGNSNYSFANVGWRLISGTGNNGTVVVNEIALHNCSGYMRGINYGTYSQYSFTFIDSTGYSHSFLGYSLVNSCNTGGTGPASSDLNEFSADGMGYALVTSGQFGTVTAPSGNTYYGTSGRNGWSADSNGNPAYTMPDTVNWLSGLQGASQVITDTSGVSATITGGGYGTAGVPTTPRNPIYVSYLDASGNTQTMTIAYKMYSVAQYHGTVPPPTTYSTGLLDSIT